MKTMNAQNDSANKMTTLSALVAVKVAGYKRHEVPVPPEMAALGHTEPAVYFSIHGKAHVPPDYAGSADAVLPLLEKHEMVDASFVAMEADWSVIITSFGENRPQYHAFGPTFPIATCRALCLAHGCTKEEVEVATSE